MGFKNDSTRDSEGEFITRKVICDKCGRNFIGEINEGPRGRGGTKYVCANCGSTICSTCRGHIYNPCPICFYQYGDMTYHHVYIKPAR